MKRTKRLQITSTVLLATQLTLINATAQTALVRSSNPDRYKTITETATTDNSVTATMPEVGESTKRSVAPLPLLAPNALTTRDPEKIGTVDRADLDVFTILNSDNPCSAFFGGRYAITALTELIRQLKPRYLDKNIAIKMSGETTTVQSQATGFSFRLFEKAEVNLGGSFFQSSPHSAVTSTFRPNTRETRVVVLLHELGHLVKGPGNQWVLPDDGTSLSQSLRNTERVVSVCRQQIDSLSKLTAPQELAMADDVTANNPPQF